MEVIRTFNSVKFEEDVKHLVPDDAIGFDPEELVSNLFNILLTDGKDNYSLFEYAGDGAYYGHYFFNSARGRGALDLARQMLKSLKQFDAKAVQVIGKTPKDNKKALWVSRQLGFKYLFDEETEVGPMEIYNLRLENYE